MVATGYKVEQVPGVVRTDSTVPLTILAQRLKALREKHGYSEEDVANELGISQPAYRKYEKNGGVESARLKKLAVFYSVTSDYLLGIVDQPAERVEEEKLPAHERMWLRVLRSGRVPRIIRDLLDEWPASDDDDKPAIEGGSQP